MDTDTYIPYLHVLNIMYGLCSDRLIINYVTTYRQSTYISTKYLEPSEFRARSNAPGNSSAFRLDRVILYAREPISMEELPGLKRNAWLQLRPNMLAIKDKASHNCVL